ncbi:MAG: acetyl-CoA C-acyltransferase [Candidatus Lokiarchaeota archaeon]|nr:acetyl-CoA C-acyltransferase [Candidatus Lokiarchaeota archaeon]
MVENDNDIVIVSACRTAIGSFGGTLAKGKTKLSPTKKFDAPTLGSIVIKEALKRANNLDPSIINDVRMGCCLEPVDAMNVARCAAFMAGVPVEVPAVTLDRVCISGMAAITSGMHQIMTGFSDIVLAGGTEAMSMVPYVVEKARWGCRLQDTTFADGLIHGLHAGSIYMPYQPPNEKRPRKYIMGDTSDFLAEKHGFTREQLDEIALKSHNGAEKATKDGLFKEEIIPIEVLRRKKDPIMFDKDEHFRPGLTMEQLSQLRPAFKKDGVTTAGNSSGINDGAAAMIIMRRSKAKDLGLEPLGKITGLGMGACEPWFMGESPIPAVRDLLRRTGRKLEEFERIEVNEAFAAQYLSVEKELGLNRDITNIHGSGIGLGHPVGCTGARIMVTLLYDMIHNDLHCGLATLCGGGGVSQAVIIERD